MKERKEFLFLPAVTVHPDCIFSYKMLDREGHSFFSNQSFKLNFSSKFNHNKLSEQARRKVENAHKYLYYQAATKKAYNNSTKSHYTFKLNFITLTLSSHQEHSDQVIKQQLLNNFLTTAKKKWAMRHYIWKAERQKNGNIHFHIVCDVYIPHEELRQVWNNIQNKLHYVDEFQKVHGHRNPNSTDIHSLRKIKNIASYLIKYMTKPTTNNRQTISAKQHNITRTNKATYFPLSDNTKQFLSKTADNGRIWGCSYSLTELKGVQELVDSEIEKDINRLLTRKEVRKKESEHYTAFYFNYATITPETAPLLFKKLSNYMYERFGTPATQLILNEFPPPL